MRRRRRCPVHFALPALLAALSAALPAQEWRVVDGPSPTAAITYDPVRQRVQVLDQRVELYEAADKDWLLRPAATGLPTTGEWRLCHDPVRHRTVALGVVDPYGALLTCEWNGATWTQRAPLHTPVLSSLAATFDPVRNAVLVLGVNVVRQGVDTWAWDGVDWQLLSQTGPPIPADSRLVFDRRRGIAVALLSVFTGGSTLQLWEWNGAQWAQRPIGQGPMPRDFFACGYDEVRQRTVLAGGATSKGPLTDFWDYDGLTWQQRTVSTRPLSFLCCTFDQADAALWARTLNGETWRWDGADWRPVSLRPRMPPSPVTASPRRGTTLRFGGALVLGPTITFFGDTWEHDGYAWSRLQVANSPSPRTGHCLWNDGSDVWLYGGVLPTTRQSNETWRFDGRGWQFVPTAQAPPGREAAAVAFDATRRRAVLFGGINQVATLADTWEFDGNNWQQPTPAASPPPRTKAAMAFDRLRGRVVMCHGLDAGGTPTPDAWEWDGQQWTQIAAPQATSPFGRQAMAFDALAGRVVLFTAEIANVGVWSYDGVAWSRAPGPPGYSPFGELQATTDAQGAALLDTGLLWRRAASLARVASYGAGCAGAAELAARTVPVLGSHRFGVELTGLQAAGLAAALFADAPANVALGGCTLLVGQPVSRLLFADAQGFAALALPVPADPSLRGRTLFCQAASLLPAVPAGFALSAGLRLLLGD